MRNRAPHSTRPHRLTSWLVLVVLVALVGLAISRWLPGDKTPATELMRNAMRVLAGRELPSTPPPQAPANPSTQREHLIAEAFKLQGIPYVWGAKGPENYDCSGFTRAAYHAIGVELPDGSFNQAEGEKPLEDPTSLTAGDLLFYRWSADAGVSHVTLYAGDGWVIGTGSPGQPREVALYPLSDDLVDDGRVVTYRHIVLSDE